ncbi:hypothetical protein AAC387_Pa08g1372 [Persea americana]
MAKKLFDGISNNGLVPDVIAFTVMINGLWKEGLMEEANELFCQMEENGYLPDTFTFNAILRGFCEINEMQKALEILHIMAKRDVLPDADTMSIVGNRFIPNRSSIDLDVARYLLVDAKKGKENKNKKVPSPLKGAYRKHLAETTMMDRTRILSFWRKPPAPTNPNGNFQEETVLANRVKSSQQKRHIPKSANRTLDALELIDDYYLNLLDWSTGNILAIALGNTVYLWNASNGFSSELLTVDEENGPVTSEWRPLY